MITVVGGIIRHMIGYRSGKSSTTPWRQITRIRLINAAGRSYKHRGKLKEDGDSGGPSSRFTLVGVPRKSAPLALCQVWSVCDLLNGQVDRKRIGKAAST